MLKTQRLYADSVKNIRLIATDMDGTLTQSGKFTCRLLQTLTDLARAGIPVLVVTGRSAGWVEGIVSYLPVQGAIAENGGIFYSADGELNLISPIMDIQNHRANLAQTFASLSAEYPMLRESSDNRFRITDWTFDVEGLSRGELQTLQERCEAQGWSFTYSTVQCHIKPYGQDKATALLEVLQAQFSNLAPDHVLTVGDSPNDESLFNPVQFPYSVGVANVLDYLNQMTYPPRFVTQHAEAEGFCEISEMLLSARMR